MRVIDIVEKKRDSHTLITEEINFFIDGHVKGDTPGCQTSSSAMAIYFQDMNDGERATLMMAMANSGDMIDLSDTKGVKVDKHSTGSVGDIATLVLASLVATVGVPVVKMSGRGLGHTGGTIDKLEAIDGFHVEIDEAVFVKLVSENKAVVVGQSRNLTPTDKKLYALRDVTSTANSIPLTASPIVSKKIAASADAIVLNVKTSSSTFMKILEDVETLAHVVVRTGGNVGRNTIAIISGMNQSLGHAIGNALELQETTDMLRRQGPKDLAELVLTLDSQMVVFVNKVETLEEARVLLIKVTNPGIALEKFRTFIKDQGGDEIIIDHPERLPQVQYRIEYRAKKSGYVTRLISNDIGVASVMLGAGCSAEEDDIDLVAGIVLNKKIGDKVGEGELLLTIHSNRQDVDDVVKKLDSGITIADYVISPTLVHKIVTE